MSAPPPPPSLQNWWHKAKHYPILLTIQFFLFLNLYCNVCSLSPPPLRNWCHEAKDYAILLTMQIFGSFFFETRGVLSPHTHSVIQNFARFRFNFLLIFPKMRPLSHAL